MFVLSILCRGIGSEFAWLTILIACLIEAFSQVVDTRSDYERNR